MCNELEMDNRSLKQSIELLKDNLKTYVQCEKLIFKKDEVINAHKEELESVSALLEQTKDSYERKEKNYIEQVKKLNEQITQLKRTTREQGIDKDRNIECKHRTNEYQVTVGE